MPENKTLSQKNFEKELKTFCNAEILGVIPKIKNPNKEDIVKNFDLIVQKFFL